MKISSFVAGVFCLAFSLTTNAQLSVEQKVGQVFIWTVSGTELSAPTAKWLTRFQPGSVIIFSRNIKSPAQIASFNTQLQELAAEEMVAPMFIMVDQEGGIVTRVRVPTPMPSALAVGSLESAQVSQTFANASGDVLRKLGFNVNLAPVLDISDPMKDSFIGSRAFGDNPTTVSDIAIHYAKGLSDAGVMPAAKHFPGHGGITQDSHFTTPMKMATYEELATRDLVPFAIFAKQDFVKAIMTAHVALPNIDPSGLPATYSSVLIGEYLRGKLGYTGLIMTDDLEMSGAAGDDIGERAVKAFIAGNDMLMLAGGFADQRKAFRAMVKAVKSGRISKSRLDQSVNRIFAAKKSLNIESQSNDPIKTRLAIQKMELFSTEILRENFMQAASRVALPPIPRSILVLSSDSRFYNGFKSEFHGETDFFRLDPKSLAQAQYEIDNPKYEYAIFYASGAKTAQWLRNLTPAQRKKTIVVNANHAGEVAQQNTFQAVLNINSHCPQSGEWLGKVLDTPSLQTPASEPISTVSKPRAHPGAG